MAWNEPGGNGKNPWEKRRGGAAPDLDKIVRDWQQRLSKLFGGGGGRRGGGSEDGAKPPGAAAGVILLALAVLAWLGSGFYTVDDAQRGVITRFGAYTRTTLPGLRWHFPWPIERVELVNVAEIVPFNQETRMLTADENIIVVDLVVQYRKADPVSYLFNVRDPEGTLRDISESAIRQVVGKNKLDFVLLEGRNEVALRTEELIQQALDEYKAGVQVTKVNLQDANFPSQVEAAVQDAIKAREDRERLSFEAEAYANDILPKARGEAVRRSEDAEAYRARVVADAQGEASRFEDLLVEYRKAPGVTRQRLYLEAVESVFANASKVVVGEGSKPGASNKLIYLPIDKLIEQRQRDAGATGARGTSPALRPEAVPAPSQGPSDLRARGVR